MCYMSVILLAVLLVQVDAVEILKEIGFGSGPESGIYERAAQRPLNKTTISFPGFNFSANPASIKNATSESNWSWNAALSIINVDSNETSYPLSSAAESTSNILNIAYTLDFPAHQLPARNETDWRICAHVVLVDWTDDVLRRASNDPGDCSTVLGASCFNEAREAWRQSDFSGSEGCSEFIAFNRLLECTNLIKGGTTVSSAPVSSFYADANGKESSYVGLKSGQIFSYETSQRFNRSQAQDSYNKFASTLGMMVLNFSPSHAYDTNHSGTTNPGEVRTFCSVLNHNLDPTNGNAASKLTPPYAIGFSMIFWTLSLLANLI